MDPLDHERHRRRKAKPLEQPEVQIYINPDGCGEEYVPPWYSPPERDEDCPQEFEDRYVKKDPSNLKVTLKTLLSTKPLTEDWRRASAAFLHAMAADMERTPGADDRVAPKHAPRKYYVYMADAMISYLRCRHKPAWRESEVIALMKALHEKTDWPEVTVNESVDGQEVIYRYRRKWPDLVYRAKSEFYKTIKGDKREYGPDGKPKPPIPAHPFRVGDYDPRMMSEHFMEKFFEILVAYQSERDRFYSTASKSGRYHP